MIITKTPYRVSFFGGGTDYPEWYQKNGGMVISAAIDKYCWITVRQLPQFFEHKYRIVYGQTELTKSIDEIVHPSVRECLRYVGINEGLEIHHDGDIPARAGMGTSSAFTVGLLNALHHMKGDKLTRIELAMDAIHVEQNLVKEKVGSQDQIACAYGGLNLITFYQSGIPKVEPICIPSNELKKLESSLLLIFTGFPHITASDIAKTYDFHNREVELNELHSITLKAYDYIIKGKIDDFGGLMNQTWEMKKRLSPQISNPYIDYLYDKAIGNGALGGKLLGAGGGGFMLFYVPSDNQDNVRKALQNLLVVPIKIEEEGSRIIHNGREE